jgi:TonB family protein
MIRTITAAALSFLPQLAYAAQGDVIDLVDSPPADASRIVLPRLLDATLVNPPESQEKNERGRVRLTFIVNTDGTVSDVKITGASQYFRLNDAAVASILSRAYNPATLDGKPVAVRIWAIDTFNPDPTDTVFDGQTAEQALNYACRYGTHRVAIDACTKLMDSGKLPPAAGLYPRANAYAATGAWDKAASDYSKLMALTKDRADLYRNRGFAYEELGQYDKAVDDYSRAIKLNPQVVGYYYDRGFVYERLGKSALAYGDFAAAMEHRPQCKKLETRGIGVDAPAATPTSGPVENISQEASPFHETNGGGPGSMIGGGGSGGAATGAGQTAGAGGGKTVVVLSGLCTPSWVMPVDQLQTVAADSPDEMQKREYRCWTLAVWNKQLDSALADCDRALALNPGFVRAYVTRGWVRMRAGDTAKAQADFAKALDRNTRLASALYLRGLLEAKVDTNASGVDILKARAIDPEIASTYARYDVGP